MSNETQQVLTAALALSQEERAELAARLIDSLDPHQDADWSSAWDKEIQRRTAELDAGRPAISWDEARRRIAGE